MKRQELTAERLRELLDYDPETGLFRWLLSRGKRAKGAIAGSKNPKGYIEIVLDYRTHLAHRLAWLHVNGEWPLGLLDHEDGVGSNNRWKNLRSATSPQNNQNCRRHRDNSSGLKGVFFTADTKRRKPWQAQIAVDGRRICLGRFETAEAAHAAYVTAAQRHHGQFARVE